MKTLSKPMTVGQPAARHGLPLTPSSPFKDLQPAEPKRKPKLEPPAMPPLPIELWCLNSGA